MIRTATAQTRIAADHESRWRASGSRIVMRPARILMTVAENLTPPAPRHQSLAMTVCAEPPERLIRGAPALPHQPTNYFIGCPRSFLGQVSAAI